MKILFVWPNNDDPFYRPISISLLSSLLKRDGHQTKCFDTSFFDFGYKTISEAATEAKIHKPVDLSPYNLGKKCVDLKKIFTNTLEEYNPDIIAITAVSGEVEIAKQISKIAKDWNNDKIIIWGGKGVLVEPERILSFPTVDYICMGEGIEALPEFVNALSKNESLKKIKNIWYEKEKGEIIKNDIRPPFKDFDSLPYLDWDIFDERLFYKPYEGAVYRGGDYMISWGCPNNCSYCINDYYHKLYNSISFQRFGPRRAIDEIKYLTQKYNIQFYKFHDEDFLVKPPDYFEELAELYQKEVNVPFTCMANSKFVTEKNVKLLKKMNCVSVSIGVETGDPKLRKEMLRRRDTHEEIIKAFKLFKDAGIRTLSFNMLAIPFETRETYFETIELNRLAQVQSPLIAFFFPFKKTGLRRTAIESGFYNPEHEKIYDASTPALEFKNLSKEELIIMRKRFVLYVKLPRTYWPFILRSEKLDEKGNSLTNELYKIYNQTVFLNNGWYDDGGKEKLYLEDLEKILRFRNEE